MKKGTILTTCQINVLSGNPQAFLIDPVYTSSLKKKRKSAFLKETGNYFLEKLHLAVKLKDSKYNYIGLH